MSGILPLNCELLVIIVLKKPKLILIDVDGTMVDSVPDLAYCVNEMMKRIDMPEHREEAIRNWVGNGVERLVRRALVGQLDGEPDENLFRQAYPIFLELYAENTSKRSELYPGILDGLNRLRDAGYILGSVTNKASQFTIPLLKDLGIYEDFAVVVAGDTLEKKKPDPAPLLYAAERMGVAPADCMMVGDSISDVTAARAAGFQIVCMPYGYNHGDDIRDAKPDAVIDSLAHLDTLLSKVA